LKTSHFRRDFVNELRGRHLNELTQKPVLLARQKRFQLQGVIPAYFAESVHGTKYKSWQLTLQPPGSRYRHLKIPQRLRPVDVMKVLPQGSIEPDELLYVQGSGSPRLAPI
jgi:hypothetical protein